MNVLNRRKISESEIERGNMLLYFIYNKLFPGRVPEEGTEFYYAARYDALHTEDTDLEEKGLLIADILTRAEDLNDYSNCRFEVSPWSRNRFRLAFPDLNFMVEYDDHMVRKTVNFRWIRIIGMIENCLINSDQSDYMQASNKLYSDMFTYTAYSYSWKEAKEEVFTAFADVISFLCMAFSSDEVDNFCNELLHSAYGDCDFYTANLATDGRNWSVTGYDLYGSLYGRAKSIPFEKNCKILRKTVSSFLCIVGEWQLTLKITSRGRMVSTDSLLLLVSADIIPQHFRVFDSVPVEVKP